MGGATWPLAAGRGGEPSKRRHDRALRRLVSLRRLADACARTGDAAGALQHLQGLFSNRQGFALCFKPISKDAVRDQSVSCQAAGGAARLTPHSVLLHAAFMQWSILAWGAQV